MASGVALFASFVSAPERLAGHHIDSAANRRAGLGVLASTRLEV